MSPLWLFCAACVLLVDYSSGDVCQQEVQREVTEYYTRRYSCGFWNWRRCTTRSRRTRIVTVYKDVCCTGSYGDVEEGCPGVCPYKDSRASSLCPGSRLCRDYQCDKSSIDNVPPATDLLFNENDNDEKLLWKVEATCFVQYSCTCGGSPCTCSKTVNCTDCTVNSTNRVAEVRNGLEIYRKECERPNCRDCTSHPGCLDHQVGHYTVNVECGASGYIDNGMFSQRLILTVTKAKGAAQINLQLGRDNDVPEVGSDAQIGHVVVTIDIITMPNPSSLIRYNLTEYSERSLFEFDSDTKQIKVASDLSAEQGGRHTLQFCVVLRRYDSCVNITVDIVRITTTSTTTSTTTTTTTAPEPEDEYICDAQDSWKALPFMDLWCHVICGPDPENCPYIPTHCRCSMIENTRLRCRAGGVYVTNDLMRENMDYWCDLNCNYAEFSNCPTDRSAPVYCECDPPAN